MAWIELHQSVWTHRKTFALADALGLDETYAAAHVMRLWTWALDNASEGSLAGNSERVIARAAGWAGDPTDFVSALVTAGWLDADGEGYAIHDWHDYAGRLIEKRRRDADRLRTWRDANKGDTRMKRVSYDVTVPNRTVPNLTQPENVPKVPTEPSVAAAPPAQEEPATEASAPVVKARPPRSVPKPRTGDGKGLAPLFDAFRALGLLRPALGDPKEAKAAGVLLKLHKADEIARCWAAVEAGRYGDGWLGENLSFAALANMNRVANFLRAEREASKPDRRGLRAVDSTPEPPAEPEALPPDDPAAETLWVQARDELRGCMTAANFQTYFTDTRGVAFDGARLIVAAKNPYLRDTLEQRFRSLIVRTLTDLSGKPADVRLVAS